MIITWNHIPVVKVVCVIICVLDWINQLLKPGLDSLEFVPNLIIPDNHHQRSRTWFWILKVIMTLDILNFCIWKTN